MAYGQKYEIQFYTTQNDLCKVKLYFDGYSGSVYQLLPSTNPFVLREFNTEEDIYKPIRAQEAEINFITNSFVSIDDFLGNSDTYCYVSFEFLSSSQAYWVGYLLQDNYQEEWTNTYHEIKLKASEGFGLLKSQQFSDDSGYELIGKLTPNQIIQYAASGTVQSFANFYAINNLYNTSMSTSDVPLNQCYIDTRAFSTGAGIYEDKYTVLEKLNRAFSQTIMQFRSRWYIIRLEEFYTNVTNNLRQWHYTLLSSSYSNVRYDLNVGVNEDIKPIEPKMIRFVNRPTKIDTVKYNYAFPDEFFYNQSFQRGTFISSGTGNNLYNLSNWYNYTGNRDTPTTYSNVYRIDWLDTYNFIKSSFIYGATTTTQTWIESMPIKVKKGDELKIDFEWIGSELAWDTPGSITYITNLPVYQIYFKSNPTPTVFKYAINSDGTWKSVTNWNSATDIKYTYPSSADATWTSFSIETAQIPYDGEVHIVFPVYQGFVPQAPGIRNLKVEYNSIQYIANQAVSGTYDKFTKSEDYRFNYDDEIYIDDAMSYNLKGALCEDSAGNLTNPTWYRYRHNTESFGFKKQNLISKWENTRFYRNKIDVTFYGLKQGSTPIGLLNSIIFTDDDPNKVYLILNLREINFAQGTWSATLLEFYDEDRDNGIEETYPTYTNGYNYK